MIKTFTLIVGLNDKDTRRQEVSTSDAKRALADIVLRYSDGATFTTCEGVYRHADGDVVFETSIKIEVFGITPDGTTPEKPPEKRRTRHTSTPTRYTHTRERERKRAVPKSRIII